MYLENRLRLSFWPACLSKIAHYFHPALGRVGILEVHTAQVMVQHHNVKVLPRKFPQALLHITHDGHIVIRRELPQRRMDALRAVVQKKKFSFHFTITVLPRSSTSNRTRRNPSASSMPRWCSFSATNSRNPPPPAPKIFPPY